MILTSALDGSLFLAAFAFTHVTMNTLADRDKADAITKNINVLNATTSRVTSGQLNVGTKLAMDPLVQSTGEMMTTPTLQMFYSSSVLVEAFNTTVAMILLQCVLDPLPVTAVDHVGMRADEEFCTQQSLPEG